MKIARKEYVKRVWNKAVLVGEAKIKFTQSLGVWGVGEILQHMDTDYAVPDSPIYCIQGSIRCYADWIRAYHQIRCPSCGFIVENVQLMTPFLVIPSGDSNLSTNYSGDMKADRER